MSNKHNLVLYIDKELVEKSRASGLNLSRTFENHLKQLVNQPSGQQNIQNHLTTKNRDIMVGLPVPKPIWVQNLNFK